MAVLIRSAVSFLLSRGLLASLGALAVTDVVQAREACPLGMAISGPTCCPVEAEYVASRNACMPYLPQRHCAEGHLDACIAAARGLEGKGMVAAGYAAELYYFACESGAAAGCRGLGLLYRDGQGLEVDLVRARALLEQACAEGDAFSCVDASELTLVVSSDANQAAELLVQACNRGAGSACIRVLRAEQGASTVSSGREHRLLEQACTGGDAEGCLLLGDAFLDGLIAPQSSARAATYYRSACEAGLSDACLRLAVLTEEGDGVLRDASAAEALYARACGAGLEPACERHSSITRAQKTPLRGSRQP